MWIPPCPPAASPFLAIGDMQLSGAHRTQACGQCWQDEAVPRQLLILSKAYRLHSAYNIGERKGSLTSSPCPTYVQCTWLRYRLPHSPVLLPPGSQDAVNRQ